MAAGKKTEKDSAVKIDSGLLESVEEFINSEENKFKYVNKKQFVDVAVSEYLKLAVKKVKKEKKKKRRKK